MCLSRARQHHRDSELPSRLAMSLSDVAPEEPDAYQHSWRRARRSDDRRRRKAPPPQSRPIKSSPARRCPFGRVASALTKPVPTPLCRRDTNDLWIASAAYAMNSTLVTTDKDFDHLQPKYISIDWIDPEQFGES